MEIFAQTSNYITKLITQFQNNEIDKSNFNKKILVNTIFSHFYFKKETKKYKKIKELQNSTFQSFFKLEYKQEQSERQLISKIRDRKSKKIVEDSIKKQRQSLLNDLSSKKDIKVLAPHTYNSYVPPKNISLSVKFQLNNKTNYNKKYIPKSDVKIQYINPNLNEREKRIITNNFIEPPFYKDFEFDLFENINEANTNESNKKDSNNNDINLNKKETGGKEGATENTNINENDELFNMIDKEDDEILFYDEKLERSEKKTGFEGWIKRYSNDDIINDFQEYKQRNSNIIGQVNDLYYTLQQDEIIKKEMELYLKNSETAYEQITKQEHFHEFTGYLSEKVYKIYIKKMNYSYLIVMLLNFFDYERFTKSYMGIIDETQILALYIKKMILNAGISASKVYEIIIHNASTKKGHLNFEDYLSCFLPIFELSEKYQFYKYGLLSFLVKKSDANVISLNNYRIFCNLIRGKLIYQSETCDDIIGKLIPILKAKYPKDDTENLNFQHVSIILEFLVSYEYGE